MAVHINTLNGGNITITTGPTTRAETRVWWSSDDSNYNDYLIEGTLDCPALIEKGLMPEGSGTEFEPYWNNAPVKVEIGSAVTSIGENAFYGCSRLTSVTIPARRVKYRSLCVLVLQQSYERDDPRQCGEHRKLGVRQLQRADERDDPEQRDEHRELCVCRLRKSDKRDDNCKWWKCSKCKRRSNY